MRYLGGKSKISKALTSKILELTTNRDKLIEPFMGGGAMTAVLAPHFHDVSAYDIHEDLILMWNALKDGWIPPSNISEDEYAQLKNSESSAMRGFAGFGGASFGGKWFGGYARGEGRNFADESSRSLLRDIKKMSNVTFSLSDYRDIEIKFGDVVYADPPYAGTTGYKNSFDSNEFWEIAEKWHNSGAKVFVSEYVAPDDWKCVWEVTRTRDLKSKLNNSVKVTEKLFTY